MMSLPKGWIPAALSLREVHTKHPSMTSRPRFAINADQPAFALPKPEPKCPSTGWLGETLRWIHVA